MAYNEKLAGITREIISLTHKKVQEKAMFGGLCFMVNDKMCVCVNDERIMVRLDPKQYDKAMKKEGCRPMEMKGKPLKGFVFVDAEVLNTKTKLAYWVKLALEYNKLAKSSKKKTTIKKSARKNEIS
ncbi:MAG: TfoX/Sxy family protein [Bacteroidota bacterium]|nr:TfoX/Sxy family protein [Bacteroidota bacterium]